MKPYHYLIVVCLAIVGCKKSEDSLKNTNLKPDTGWKALPDIPSGPRAYATGFTLNNKGYICGGVNQFAGSVPQGYDDMYMYDPVKNTWLLKAGLPDIGYGVNEGRMQAYSFVVNNTAYAGGGISVNGIGGRDLEQYDTVANTWRLIANKPAINLSGDFDFSSSAAVACNNMGYIFSYSSSGHEVLTYDPVKNILTNSVPLVDMSVFMSTSFSLSSSGTELYYAAGGSSFAIIDPITGNRKGDNISSSSTAIPPAEGVVSLTGNFYKNCLYVSVGDEGHLYRFSFNTNKWSQISGLTMGITNGVTGFIIGSKLYYVGGNNGVFSAATSKAWVIDLAAYPDN